jgi:hypothetical protein
MPLTPAGDTPEANLAPFSSHENLLADWTRKVLLMFTPIVSFLATSRRKQWIRGRNLFGTIGGSAMNGLFQIVGQSLTRGAATAIYLAASPEVKKKGEKGKYFIPIATEDKTSRIAEDRDLTRNLWYWCDDKVTKTLRRGWEESGI